MKILLCLAVGYLIGSVNVAILLSKVILGNDIRKQGSGNAGATNMARVFGWGAGIATFACDFLKGIVSMLIGQWLLGDMGLALAGFACLLGHCFPLYHKFKGGKAVSVGASVGLMIDWRCFVAILLTFIVVVAITKIVSISSICGALSIMVVAPMVADSPWKIALAFAGALLLIFMHRSNIKRLLKGEEPKFHAGSRKK